MLTSNRWWIYQRERFPILAHGVLITVFSSSAVSYSRLLRGQEGLPGFASMVTAVIVATGALMDTLFRLEEGY